MGEQNVGMSGSRQSSKRLAKREAAALSLAGSVLLVVATAALAVTGDLTEPAGTAGCISETGAGPCADGHALNRPHSVAVSPDGKSVYVASRDSNAVVRFNRNTTTGAISQPAGAAGCVSETGAGPCGDGRALHFALSVAVSPDGKNVYVGSDSAVARFNRNTTTGAITQPASSAGCVSQPGYTAEPCADGHGLVGGIYGVAASPDGKSVYAAGDPGVARFNRNTTTGAITQPAGSAGCVNQDGTDSCTDGHGISTSRSVAVSPDGRNIYVASQASSAVARFNRNTATGAISQPAGTAGCVGHMGTFGECAEGRGLNGAASVTVSPDGKSVYAASAGNSNAVARFNRTTTTGAITQPAGTAGCVSNTGSGPCADGRALGGATGVAVSPDGKTVYAAALLSKAVVRLDRNTTTGAITQPAGTAAGCVSETGSGPCVDGRGLDGANSVTVSPGGKSVYVASRGSASLGAVARFNRTPSPFVERAGTHLFLQGNPYRFTGLNIYNANSDGDCWYAMSSGSTLGDSLDAIGSGKEAIRAWFFQSLATSAGQRDWSAFDHTLSVARAHGVKVIATLTNQWGDCEAGGYKTDSWYTGGYKQADPGGTVSYRDWVSEVVTRYRNDPTILAWQLVNEAEVKPSRDASNCSLNAAATLKSFATDVSGLAKSVDPNHLVSLGTMGGGQCGAQSAEYSDVHSVPTIDLCEYHDYEPQAPMPGDQWNGLQVRIDQCNALDKPLFVGETGIIPNDVGGTLQSRADALDAKLQAQFSAGIVGDLEWAWSALGSTLGDYDVGAGDPVLGVLGAY
jgi:DNA-binding beta-propeller fold protein YncE